MSDKKFENVHWADHSAQRTIDAFPNEKVYTVASGITPSGFIHIGNFREVITTEIVRRALEDKGIKTKFIYSWDSYDAFRKVPKDVPKEWEKYLRMPVGTVPNPFKSKQETYAEHFMNLFEEEVKPFNFPVTFQKQVELQASGIYAESIKEALNNKQIIIDELNKYRGEDQQLESTWWPIDIYDKENNKDNTQVLSYDGKYTLKYKTEDGKEESVNFKKDPRVKLRWKADWPMRWDYFKVNYEAAGKDHGTHGSSFTVGDEIIKKVFNRQPPVHSTYDFVLVKGQGGKISSSKGGALRVKDVLEVYTPEMVLFLFAGTRPNSEIHISFDADVIKLYEDFDKLERLYFGEEHEKNEKQRANKIRQYELSIPNGVKIPKKLPFQPQFRHLTVVSQACDFDYKKVKEYYKESINTKFDEQRLEQRFICAKNWLEEYAPEDFTFTIKKELGEITQVEEVVLKFLEDVLPQAKESGKEYVPFFKKIDEYISNMDMKEFFKHCYLLLIGKEKGPKISDFLFENKDKFIELLETEYTINNKKYEMIIKTDFSKTNLKVGKIIDANIHPETNNLQILKIDISNEDEKDIRTVVFSIENGYTQKELIGKKVVVLANLKPSKFKGVESQAMVVACENDKKCGVLTSNLDIGENISIYDPKKDQTEIANSQEYITKEDFLNLPFKGIEGKVFFEKFELENIEIDRDLTGKIC